MRFNFILNCNVIQQLETSANKPAHISNYLAERMKVKQGHGTRRGWRCRNVNQRGLDGDRGPKAA